ncbi:AhpC/TSA family protein [Pedobacter sp. MC2016-14]|uniref:TlpA disulfide reductase family protein n=1 Tax=Pedobacter sp. MC2016-14 TaxID=2897327 RepID=UPI001E6490CA|nr:TlpA disulfide reductase family protein [Pedobacter sp. MC2016-14]MCD0488100.1 AhpC/TSA family protein [Pedobacter sp. MC2016-14]
MKNISLKAARLILALTFLCCMLFIALTSAFKADGYVIEGNIIAPDGEKVWISYEYSGKKFLDSAVVKNNKVLLKGSLPETVLCTLSNSSNQQSKVILLQNEHVRLIGTMAKFYYAEVSGAAEDALFNKFNKKKFVLTGDYRKELEASSTDFHDRASRVYLDFQRRLDSLTLAFVKENPNATAASIAIIGSHMNSTNVLKAEACYAQLTGLAKRGYYAKRIKAFIDASKAITVGKQAPNFILTDLDGKTFELSKYRGKYLFIDFWASWCKPCREEHPLLKKLNAAYKDQNILFVSISMEASEKNWRQAVADDGLSWIQLNDPGALKGSLAKSYSVMALPCNFILDPNGKIIATKARGQELSDFLLELFSKSK